MSALAAAQQRGLAVGGKFRTHRGVGWSRQHPRTLGNQPRIGLRRAAIARIEQQRRRVGPVGQVVEHRESFDEAEMNVVRVHIDALRMVIAQHLEGDGGAAGKALVRGLQLVIAKVSGQP